MTRLGGFEEAARVVPKGPALVQKDSACHGQLAVVVDGLLPHEVVGLFLPLGALGAVPRWVGVDAGRWSRRHQPPLAAPLQTHGSDTFDLVY
jgi:hypothetical protein